MNYSECLYLNASRIVNIFEEAPYLSNPIAILIKIENGAWPLDLLKAIIILLADKGHPVYPFPISVSGIKVIENSLSESEYRIIASETLVSYKMSDRGGLPIQEKKQCEQFLKFKCSIIVPIHPNDPHYDQIQLNLAEIGFNVISFEITDKFDISTERKKQILAEKSQETTDFEINVKKLKSDHWSGNDRWIIRPPLVPTGPPQEIYFPEKDPYAARTLPVFYIAGREIKPIFSVGEPGWVESKILYCPHCFKSVLLGRDRSSDSYRFHPDFDICSDLLIDDETDFTQHVDHCHPRFPRDGIFEILTAEQAEIADKFSLFSKRDCRWDAQTVTKHSFADGDFRGFVLVSDGIPVSYVAFRKRNYDEVGDAFILWDLYTVPDFRGNRFASTLLDHAIRILSIDPDLFFVSFPVSKFAKNVVMNHAGAAVVMVQGYRSCKIDKNELLHDWGKYCD